MSRGGLNWWILDSLFFRRNRKSEAAANQKPKRKKKKEKKTRRSPPGKNRSKPGNPKDALTLGSPEGFSRTAAPREESEDEETHLMATLLSDGSLPNWAAATRMWRRWTGVEEDPPRRLNPGRGERERAAAAMGAIYGGELRGSGGAVGADRKSCRSRRSRRRRRTTTTTARGKTKG